jgi:hypothetical protein
VPPKISSSFAFPPRVIQGSRVQVICSVQEGDIEDNNLTVTIVVPPGLFGQTNNFVKVVHIDAFSAMLIIDRVDSHHMGNYTCKIQNSIQEVSQTVPLVVHGTKEIFISSCFSMYLVKAITNLISICTFLSGLALCTSLTLFILV